MPNRLLRDGSPPAALWVAPAALLVIALGDNLNIAPYPDGYFTFMGLVIMGAAGLLAAVRLKRDAHDGWGWIFLALALLYNVIWPPLFTRPYWLIFNSAAAAIFILKGRRVVSAAASADRN